MSISQYQNYFQNQIIQRAIPGRIVNSFDEIQVQEIPMDNQGAYFIKSDLSETELRKWNCNGQIENIRFKRVEDVKPNNLTQDVIESENDTNNSISELLQNEFSSINDRLDKIEKIITPKKKKDEGK